MSPRVFVIIVNWNGLADTLSCLTSLNASDYDNFQITVVDNGSRKHEADAIKSAHPNTTVVRTRRNLGFTGGNNRGLAIAYRTNPKYVLLLNNDTVVAPNCLRLLVDALEKDPQSCMASATIFHFDEPDEIWFNGGGLCLDPNTLGPEGASWHLPPSEHADEKEPYQTDFATACALLVKTSFIQCVGGFDNRFFAYCEDVDLSITAAKKNVRRLVVPQAKVWHKISRSSGGSGSLTVGFYQMRNNSLLALKHLAPKQAKSFTTKYFKPRKEWAVQMLNDANAPAKVRSEAQTVISAYMSSSLRLFGNRNRYRWLDIMIELWARHQPVAHSPLLKPYWFTITKVSQVRRRLRV